MRKSLFNYNYIYWNSENNENLVIVIDYIWNPFTEIKYFIIFTDVTLIRLGLLTES